MNSLAHWLRRSLQIGFPCYLLLIAVLCLHPKEETVPVGFHDKILHATAYGVGALIAMNGFVERRSTILILLFIWGVLMEIGQRFAPGRSFEYADMLANGIGIALGIGLFCACRQLSSRRLAHQNI